MQAKRISFEQARELISKGAVAEISVGVQLVGETATDFHNDWAGLDAMPSVTLPFTGEILLEELRSEKAREKLGAKYILVARINPEKVKGGRPGGVALLRDAEAAIAYFESGAREAECHYLRRHNDEGKATGYSVVFSTAQSEGMQEMLTEVSTETPRQTAEA